MRRKGDGNSHHRQILEFYYLLIASGSTNFGSLTELLAFDQGLLVFCFPPSSARLLNGITGTYLFIKVVVYDGGQLFRPFSLCIFQNLSCLYDGGQLFRPFLLLFYYYYPGRNPLLSF